MAFFLDIGTTIKLAFKSNKGQKQTPKRVNKSPCINQWQQHYLGIEVGQGNEKGSKYLNFSCFVSFGPPEQQ